MAQRYPPSVLADRARDLATRYSTTAGPVAYLDETFSLQRGGKRFYAITGSVIDRQHLSSTREALLAAYDGDPLHASEMLSQSRRASLETAIATVASQPMRSCVVVQTAIHDDDTYGDTARRICMANLLRTLSTKMSVMLFVADSRGKADADRVDTDLLRALRSNRKVDRSVELVHRMPSEEPLIGLADVSSWAFRQRFLLTRHRDMGDPLSDLTSVHVLKRGPIRL